MDKLNTGSQAFCVLQLWGEWTAISSYVVEIGPNICSHETLKTNILLHSGWICVNMLQRRFFWSYCLKWFNFSCIPVKHTLIVSSNMNRFLVGFWEMPDGNVKMWITSCLLCILFRCISPTPSVHQSHLLPFSPSSSHNQTSQITFSEMKSVSVCLMCRTVPVYSTVVHCKKNESYRVDAQILMWAAMGRDGGSLET